MTKFACTERSRSESTNGESRWVSAVALWVSMAGMKRASRIVLKGMTGLSLVLCVAALVLWVWSYSRRGTLLCVTDDSQTLVIVILSRNDIYLEISRSDSPQPSWKSSPFQGFQSSSPTNAPLTPHSFLGVGWGQYVDTRIPLKTLCFSVLLLQLMALFSLLPAIRLFRRLRCRKLNRPGRCATCGYDLRATPDRCPECGTPAPAPPSTLGQSTAIGA
jgi:hypothetical protein